MDFVVYVLFAIVFLHVTDSFTPLVELVQGHWKSLLPMAALFGGAACGLLSLTQIILKRELRKIPSFAKVDAAETNRQVDRGLLMVILLSLVWGIASTPNGVENLVCDLHDLYDQRVEMNRSVMEEYRRRTRNQQFTDPNTK